MEHPAIKRLEELLGLIARLWWILAIGFLLGVREIAEIVAGSRHHLYALGAIAAFTLIAVLFRVAYQALARRDQAIGERDSARSERDAERSEVQALRNELAQRPPREAPKPGPLLQLPDVPHEVRHTEDGRMIFLPLTDDEAKEIKG